MTSPCMGSSPCLENRAIGAPTKSPRSCSDAQLNIFSAILASRLHYVALFREHYALDCSHPARCHMALRSSWEGFLRLNLISVPVKAYSATQKGKGRIGFHLIHEKCHNRIRYEKVCPVHGEVPNDEIVSGYEVAKGQYVLVKPEELKNLKAESDKSINLDVFIKPDELDPVYYTDRTYYLAPDGKVGDKPYAMLHQVMSETKRYAVGTMIFTGREHVVLVRPAEKLLAVTFLSFHNQVKLPAAFADEAPDEKVSGQELKLARTLVEASTSGDFDYA